jgi:hypothetical protein
MNQNSVEVPAGTRFPGMTIGEHSLAGVNVADITIVGRWSAATDEEHQYALPIAPQALKPPAPTPDVD